MEQLIKDFNNSIIRRLANPTPVMAKEVILEAMHYVIRDLIPTEQIEEILATHMNEDTVTCFNLTLRAFNLHPEPLVPVSDATGEDNDIEGDLDDGTVLPYLNLQSSMRGMFFTSLTQ